MIPPPSDDRSSLGDYLGSLETGRLAEEGVSFTLDPRRAASTLRSQGRLGDQSFLYLLAAIHQHTRGRSLVVERSARVWRLCWSAECGPLAESVDRIIAEESFSVHGVVLDFSSEAVLLKPGGLLSLRAALILGPLLDEVESRLTYYPWRESTARALMELSALACEEVEGARIHLRRSATAAGRITQVVRGIDFPRAWSLPVDAVVFDNESAPDLSLSVVPDSARRRAIEAAAERLFLEALRESVVGAKRVVLRADNSSIGELPLFFHYLGYLLRNSSETELGRMATDLVIFLDITGREWSATQLLQVYQREGRLLVVSVRPEFSESRQAPELPVLVWDGQASSIGSSLFPSVAPGEGYLYSLEVNLKERQRVAADGEERLASLPVEGGRLSLLAWGEPDRPALVEFVGPRRATETFYLDSEAPKGLRLHLESDRPLEESLRELSFEQPLRQSVLELLDSAAGAGEALEPGRLSTTLLWATCLGGSLVWSKLRNLSSLPLFERVDGSPASLDEVWIHQASQAAVPVLTDRSTSLPPTLSTGGLLLWAHPLLIVLKIAITDYGRLAREAHWRQAGRERWLKRHAPSAPHWEHEDVYQQEGHSVSRQPDPATPTEVVFWREERPFGRYALSTDQCPRGYLVLWRDDEIEGDTYWSGPDRSAVEARISAIAALCEKAEAALPWRQDGPGEKA